MTSRDRSLKGRRALVTGASRGIGKEIALTLAEAGADVAVTARSEDQLDDVVDRIEDRETTGLAVPCDITDPEQVDRLAEEVATRLGPVQILVNNAGVSDSHPFRGGHPDELWHRMIDVNLHGTYYVTRALVDQIVDNGWGRIINNASVVSKTSSRYIAAYTASKHGVLGLTRALAVELVDDNVTVNAICPGYVDTPMTDRNIQSMMQKTDKSEQELRDYLAAQSPQNRLMTTEEVAGLTLFLCRDVSRGINGQAINIDGGELLY